MNKYIDAEKLKADIEKRLKNIRDYINGAGVKYKGPKFYKAQGKESAYDALLSVTYSLQQEQPEPSNNLVNVDAVREDFIKQVYRVLDADPTNDRANAIIDAFDSLPTVSQVQPEEAYIFKPNMTIDEMKDSINGKQKEISFECGVRVYPKLDGKPRPWVSLYGKGINTVSFRDLPELECLGFKDDDTAIVTIARK